MIITDAIRSLKNSMAKAVFYWLTFVLTSLFIFLFFNISMSESLGFTWVENNNDTVTTVTVFVIAVCLIIIFFANDFFVKNKAKELAIRLVCGATFMQLAQYLLVQTFVLLLIALPFVNRWMISRLYKANAGMLATEYRFGESGVRTGTGEASSIYTWAAFRELYHSKGVYYLFIDANHAMILPERSFTQGEPAAFGPYMAEKTGQEMKEIK